MSSDTVSNIYIASSGIIIIIIIIINLHGKSKALSVNAKEKYGGAEVQLHTFLNSAPDSGEG